MHRTIISITFWASLAISLFTIQSCSKAGDDFTANDGKVYYDYYSYAPHPLNAANDTIETHRVCYDLTNKQVVWDKKNEWAYTSYFSNINTSQFLLQYSKGFSIPNYLIKIFASSDFTSVFYPVKGIYFQKIDKTTGEAVVSKRILGPSDFNVNLAYSMSEVVSDGSNYFFACNNGSIYSFDNNGNQVWKKNDYPIANSWSSSLGGYALMYHDEGSLYFSAFDLSGTVPSNIPILFCLNASNGERRWSNYGTDFIYGRNIAFGKNHFAMFDVYGRSTLHRKSDGVDIAVNAGTGTNGSVRILPLGSTDNTHLIYSNRSGDIGYIDTEHPSDTRFVDTPPVIDDNFIYLNGRIYSILFDYPSSTITVSCIDPLAGAVWNKAIPIVNGQTAGQNGPLHFSYLISNSKLYILSNCRFDNNSVAMGTAAGANKIGLYVAVVDPASGGVVREYSGLPGGLPNFHRLLNMVVE